LYSGGLSGRCGSSPAIKGLEIMAMYAVARLQEPLRP
jgi:hypothetical protein